MQPLILASWEEDTLTWMMVKISTMACLIQETHFLTKMQVVKKT
jgi:hypothetical protein